MNGPVIQVGLAGFGMSGQLFHAPFLRADPRFHLKKVYERTSDRSREAYPGTEVVRTFEALLTEEIDLVVITTPNPCHVPMATQAMQAGKHVIVEKPVAASSQEAEALCRLAEEKAVLFSVYQNRRLDGDFLTVKKLIDGGRLGEVVDYECHFDRFVRGRSAKPWKREGGRGIDILYDLGIHLLDQAYALFGMPGEVCADLRTQRPESAGTDRFTITLYYPDKEVRLSAGELVALPGPRFTVHGRQGSFLTYGQDPQEGRLLRGLRPGEAGWESGGESARGTLATVTDGGITQETVVIESGNYGEYYDNFYRALRCGATLLVQPQEAVEVLRLLEAARRSSSLKRHVCLAR